MVTDFDRGHTTEADNNEDAEASLPILAKIQASGQETPDRTATLLAGRFRRIRPAAGEPPAGRSKDSGAEAEPPREGEHLIGVLLTPPASGRHRH
jgi:hypothetical protein